MTALLEYRWTCVSSPVQAEGRLSDGRWFYFRARYERVSLSASPVNVDDAVLAGIERRPGAYVDRDFSDFGKYYASHLDDHDHDALLAEMAAELVELEVTA